MTKVTYFHSEEFELRKLVYMIHEIKNNFYQPRNFYLAKEIEKDLTIRQKGNILLINEQIYSYLINRFNWDRLGFDSENILRTGDIGLYDDFLPLLNFKKLESHWNLNKLKECIEVVAKFFDVKVTSVEICMTSLGTMGAFTTITRDPYSFRLYPRFDNPDAIRGYTGMLIREIYPNRPWDEYQSLQNFIVDHTVVKKILNSKYTVTLSPVVLPSHIVINSNKYFEELGYPVESTLNISEDKIYIKNDREIDNLSKLEHKILMILVANRGKVLSNDFLLEKLWCDPEKFSLQALTKAIERVRKKLKSFGIYKNVIQTIRGRGYRYCG